MPFCPKCDGWYDSNEFKRCPRCNAMLSEPVYVARHENVGSNIQYVSYIELGISAIATIVCAIAFGRDLRGDFRFGSFLLILLVGSIVSAVTFMLLYAFGRLVESSIWTEENTKESLRVLMRIAHAQEGNMSKRIPQEEDKSKETPQDKYTDIEALTERIKLDESVFSMDA